SVMPLLPLRGAVRGRSALAQTPRVRLHPTRASRPRRDAPPSPLRGGLRATCRPLSPLPLAGRVWGWGCACADVSFVAPTHPRNAPEARCAALPVKGRAQGHLPTLISPPPCGEGLGVVRPV